MSQWNVPPELIFHYIPREICILVQTPGALDIGKAIAVHQDLMAKLNPALQDTLKNVVPAAGTLFDEDYSPSPDIWSRCTIDAQGPLKPLTRWIPERRFAQMNVKNDHTNTLHFFAVDLHPTGPTNFTEQDRAAAIRDLVNIINKDFRPGINQDLTSCQILASTPNWLASQSGGTDGWNPGTPPLPDAYPAGDERVHFTDAVLQGHVAAQRAVMNLSQDVVVAVLDTSPSSAVVTNAPTKFGGNRLIGAVANVLTGIRVDEPLSPGLPQLFPALAPGDFAHVADFVPNWGELLRVWTHTPAPARPALRRMTFDAPDHGLFVAGIIKDIAPSADVHLIRVLDSCGMGDLLTLATALVALPDMLNPGGERRLIVNLSLGLDVPEREQLRQIWFPLSFADPAFRNAQNVILDLVHVSFKTVIDWLLDQEVLIVASTGNDALGLAAPPPARLPARYDRVLSVAAITRRGERSSFSNQGTATGVAVFGGDADIRRADNTVEIKTDPVDNRPDAVVGIFESDALPFGAGNNANGWAYWAGTSFAAPIITAIAAVEYMAARAPNMLNATLITTIQGYASIDRPELGVRGIAAMQI